MKCATVHRFRFIRPMERILRRIKHSKEYYDSYSWNFNTFKIKTIMSSGKSTGLPVKWTAQTDIFVKFNFVKIYE